MRKVRYPKRRVILTFTHDTCGDNHFSPMVEKAIDERREAIAHGLIAETHEFNASNGVLVVVSGYEVSDGWYYWWPLVRARAFIRGMIWRAKGMESFTYQAESGQCSISLMFNRKTRPESVMKWGTKFNLLK